jgi:hypothetical protein
MSDQSSPFANLARIAAGAPGSHSSLYWRIRFCVHDQVVLIEVPTATGTESTLILRDIEMDRARQFARVDHVACPKHFTPAGGLSGDRETANAQAAAEFLRRAGVTRAVGDRTFPSSLPTSRARRASPSSVIPSSGSKSAVRKPQKKSSTSARHRLSPNKPSRWPAK